eukprot:scaffold7204_cov354-Prasinococcus_capsulatus_cf.AAC.3
MLLGAVAESRAAYGESPGGGRRLRHRRDGRQQTTQGPFHAPRQRAQGRGQLPAHARRPPGPRGARTPLRHAAGRRHRRPRATLTTPTMDVLMVGWHLLAAARRIPPT